MSERINELQTACNIIEQYMIQDFNHDDLLATTLNTALSSMKFELEFCFNIEDNLTQIELPEDW